MSHRSAHHRFNPDRRKVLLGATALGSAALLPAALHAAPDAVRSLAMRARIGRVNLVGAVHPDTDVWCYENSVPGPEIRVRQGDRLRIAVANELAQPTTVHWHGVRLPNAMDGVPHLTQAPIAPGGGSFVYEFAVPDAGTFWYHPHERSFEQVGRGLCGALIVEERAPIRVDRDLTWVLSDWRLGLDAQLISDFGNFMEVSHGGRIGNTVTINGRLPDTLQVRSGERLRLRLINAANGRIFALEFRGLSPQVIAYDGQPVAPHAPPGGRVVLGPAMRVDLVLDMMGAPGDAAMVADTFYPQQAYRLVTLAYGPETPLRTRPLDAPIDLPPNALSEPDIARSERHEVVFGGGMMGGMRGATLHGQHLDMMDLARHGMAWAINGVAVSGHVHEPLLVLQRGRTYVLSLRNDTAWYHPIHLHGHTFRVITRDGQPTRWREWRDTVLLAPREQAEIAFVADNPGDWMFHCHILEHQAGGMMGAVRVA